MKSRKNFLTITNTEPTYKKASKNKKTVLTIVDIQPAYEEAFTFDLFVFTDFLNKSIDLYDRVIYFFNEPSLTHTHENEKDMRIWLLENGLNEETLDKIEFYEKTYGFLSCIHETSLRDELVKVLRYMKKNGISDSRDLSSNYLKRIYPSLRIYLEEDVCFLPKGLIQILESIEKNSKIELIGGSVQACLLEVDVLCEVLRLDFNQNNLFTY